MCGKVLRKEGMGRGSSKLQYKPDLHNTTTRLSIYCERAWQCGRMRMRVILHSRKLHRRIFRIMLHYSTVCAAPAQNTSQLRQIGQLSRNDL